jgi:hypothetical protein
VVVFVSLVQMDIITLDSECGDNTSSFHLLSLPPLSLLSLSLPQPTRSVGRGLPGGEAPAAGAPAGDRKVRCAALGITDPRSTQNQCQANSAADNSFGRHWFDARGREDGKDHRMHSLVAGRSTRSDVSRAA